jgi:hypothetical protein
LPYKVQASSKLERTPRSLGPGVTVALAREKQTSPDAD